MTEPRHTDSHHPDAHHPDAHHADSDHAGPHSLPPELAELLREVLPADGRFGHRQHVQLAFLACRQLGTSRAETAVSRWLRHLTEYERAPQKYHATMTHAWTRIVGHHVQASPDVSSFAEFAGRYPQLLDKRLLSRHYSSARLASAAARREWVEPDRTSFPWS